MGRRYIRARESLARRLRGQTLWEYILVVALITAVMLFIAFLIALSQQSS